MRFLILNKNNEILVDGLDDEELLVDDSVYIDNNEDAIVFKLLNDYKSSGSVGIDVEDGELIYTGQN